LKNSDKAQEFEADAQLECDKNALELAAAFNASYRSGGWPSALHNGIEVSLAQSKTGYLPPYRIAELYADLGDNEHAFEWLNIAYQQRGHLLYGIRTDFPFDFLRTYPVTPNWCVKSVCRNGDPTQNPLESGPIGAPPPQRTETQAVGCPPGLAKYV